MLSRPLRALGATFGLVLLLGCSGILGDDDEEDGVAELDETGDTGEADEADEEDEEDDGVDSAPIDTGRKRKPRDGKRGKRDRKEREKPGGGRDGKKKKPKPNPGVKSLCFGGGGLDLQLTMDGTDVEGSLKLAGKADVKVKKLTGTRKGSRVDVSGNGTVQGKKQKVSVQAGKNDSGPVVQVDGRKVKGAKIVDCP